jgi:hypothetical protein
MKTIATFKSRVAALGSSLLLAGSCVAADHFIGINFAGGYVHGAPTSLLSADVAGVVPQVGWNNYANLSATNSPVRDNSGGVVGVQLTFFTGEIWASGAYDVNYNDPATGFPMTNGNCKLMNGYIDSLDPANTVTGTNTVTLAGLNKNNTYTVIAYMMRDSGLSAGQSAYWVNDDNTNAIHVIAEDAQSYWLFDPTFHQVTNLDNMNPGTGNYVRWDGVKARPDGTLSVSLVAEDPFSTGFTLRGALNGIQVISTNAWPTNNIAAALILQPANRRTPLGQTATFSVAANGPWDFQWYSNNVPTPGATQASYTTVPILTVADTLVDYKVSVSNNVNVVFSQTVRVSIAPALPPGGIFYDPFDYPVGALGNIGDWTPANIAQVVSPGLRYTDAEGSVLVVSGNALVGPIDWDPFPNEPIKLFGTQTFGGPNTTNYMSYLFDFTYMNPTNNAGYFGVSVFQGDPSNWSSWDWGNEKMFVGKTWYNDYLGTTDGNGTIGYWTNGFLVARITQDDANRTVDVFLNPPLSGLPETPDFSTTASGTITYNAIGINSGEWAGVKGNHDVWYLPPGPIVDEFRFGTTYSSVAPVAVVLNAERVGTSLELSWGSALIGYSLQQSDSLTNPHWVSAPSGNPVTVPINPAQPTRFYRLVK